MPSTHEISRHAARGSLWRRWIRAPSWAAARWPLVVWEPGDSASQCHGVLNISEISPPSILWQQPAVTCDSFYLHTALHCTPHCNNARVPQFGLDNVINCWQATWLAKILKTVRQLQTSTEHPNFKCRPTSLSVKALAGAFSKHSVVVTISMLKLRNPNFCTACTSAPHIPCTCQQAETTENVAWCRDNTLLPPMIHQLPRNTSVALLQCPGVK